MINPSGPSHHCRRSTPPATAIGDDFLPFPSLDGTSLALRMGDAGSPPSRRDVCLRCFKVVRLCLCSRLPSPPLDNPVGVTVLQHHREASHPLNSARLAALGLRNVAVVPVSDVNFCSLFLLAPLATLSQDKRRTLTCTPIEVNSVSSMQSQSSEGTLIPDNQIKQVYTKAGVECYVDCDLHQLYIFIERGTRPDLSSILASPTAKALLKHGFTVKKLHRKQLSGTLEFKDFEEFNIVIPHDSVLLFPGKTSLVPEDVNFEVKHVIVLDGTWAKANRMRYENPWLQLLPWMKLETDQKSLYSEVRHQPKDGCLSTIESIVCAMKALGSDIDGLDNLLNVFASMICDQRRCKDEKCSRTQIS